MRYEDRKGSETGDRGGSVVPTGQSSDRVPAAPDLGHKGVPSSPGYDDYDAEGFDWRYFLHLVWRKKWWVILATSLGIAAGIFLSSFVSPLYETRSTIWVEEADDSRGPIQARAVFQGQGWSELFTSLAVLEPVARKMDLHLDSEARSSAAFASFEISEDVRPGQYQLAVDSARRFFLTTAEGTQVDQGRLGEAVGDTLGFQWTPEADQFERGATVTFKVTTPTQAALKIREKLSTIYDRREGNLITTRLTWTDPEEGARIHNEVVQSFLSVAADLKSKHIREVVRVLRQQTEYSEQRLANAELKLENARVENITLPSEGGATPAPGPGGATMRDPVFDAYFEKKLELEKLRSDREQLTTLLQQGIQGMDTSAVLRLQGSTAASQSPELQASLKEYFEKKAKRQTLLYTYTEEHPKVQELDDQLRVLLNQSIPAQVRQVTRNLRSEIASLEEQIRAQERDLQEIPPRYIREERLRREMEQAEALHSDLLNRLKSAELAASTTRPNLQVVDQAHTPNSPMSDQGPRVFLMASMAGLVLGFGGVFLSDRLDNRMRQPKDIDRILGIPVLGMIPRITSSGKREDLTAVALEAFRSVRGQLTRSFSSAPSAILITSPEPRDGKSVVAANLSMSFASVGRSTLLIDADMRRGNADVLFDLPEAPGLTEYLTGEAEVSDILRPTQVPGLVLVPHGEMRGFNPDRLEGDRLAELFEHLRKRFETIVVDAPPLAAGADALVVGELCDQAVLVLRMNATNLEVARNHLEKINHFDFPLVGSVLNDVPESAPYYPYSSYLYHSEQGRMIS